MYIKLANILLNHAANKHGSKFVGIPANRPMFDFHIEQKVLKLPGTQKTGFRTISPIK